MSKETCTIICHGSAQRLWRRAESVRVLQGLEDAVPVPAVSSNSTLSSARASRDVFALASPFARAGYLDGVLDVLVSRRCDVHRIEGASVHQCAVPLPDGSFVPLGNGLYVSSPELSFLQMARLCSLPQLVVYGMELSSRYFIDPDTRSLANRDDPLTTPSRLVQYASKAQNLKGRAKALSSLRWILPGAESPMETRMVALLCLPRRIGGYGLPLPELNRIVRPGRLAASTNQSFYRPDASWVRHRVALEYDGKASHEDAHKDKQRINGLESLGWKVFSVTGRDLYDMQSFERIALSVARSIGYRVRRAEGWHHKALSLRVQLGMVWVEQS